MPPHEFTPPYDGLPPKYNFTAWVRMNDFTPRGRIRPKFYGIIVQRKSDPNSFILALRGTNSGTEWFDDFMSIFPVAMPGFPGKIGEGFGRIFGSMEVIGADGQPTDKFGHGFVNELRAAILGKLIRRAARIGAKEQAAVLDRVNVEVTGHSLGAALATLYVAANASDRQLRISRVYTFASPLVGNTEFVAAFENLHVDSWRIANPLDIVTVLPAIGYRHVDKLEQVNSGNWVNRTPICLHSMTTYLHLVHPPILLDKPCEWDPTVPGANIGGHTS
jgi:hypothetical protein